MNSTARLTLAALAWTAAAAGAAAPLPYQDPTQPVEARLADLLGRMTLEEKVAQLQDFVSADPKAFDEQGIFVGGADAAGLANGAGMVWPGDELYERIAKDPRMQIRSSNSIQRFLQEHSRLKIPVFSFA